MGIASFSSVAVDLGRASIGTACRSRGCWHCTGHCWLKRENAVARTCRAANDVLLVPSRILLRARRQTPAVHSILGLILRSTNCFHRQSMHSCSRQPAKETMVGSAERQGKLSQALTFEGTGGGTKSAWLGSWRCHLRFEGRRTDV
jgi:hypothetical protein